MRRSVCRSYSVIRAVLHREGIRVPSGSVTVFMRRLQQVVVPRAQAAVGLGQKAHRRGDRH